MELRILRWVTFGVGLPIIFVELYLLVTYLEFRSATTARTHPDAGTIRTITVTDEKHFFLVPYLKPFAKIDGFLNQENIVFFRFSKHRQRARSDEATTLRPSQRLGQLGR